MELQIGSRNLEIQIDENAKVFRFLSLNLGAITWPYLAYFYNWVGFARGNCDRPKRGRIDHPLTAYRHRRGYKAVIYVHKPHLGTP